MGAARVAIVGVGAIGGAVAADLAERGALRLALCARSPFAQLVVAHPGGESRIDGPAHTSPAAAAAELCEEGPIEWLLLAVKAHQSEAARPWLEALTGPGSRVAVLQNGVDHRERIAPLLPEGAAVLPVVVQLPAEKTAPGRVEQSRDGLLMVPDDPDGQAFTALFAGARTRVEPRADFASQAWWKLLSNAALGAICALTLRPNRAVADPEIRALALALMREVASVARAEGAALPDDAPEKVLARILAAAPEHWSSIAVDRREDRPMEWEARNAVVGRRARAHGIATPLNDALTTLLRVADRRFGEP